MFLKKFLLIMVVAFGFTINASAQDLIAPDKVKHMYVGAGIYGLCVLAGGVLEEVGYKDNYLTPATCLIPVAVAGIGKEVYDYQHPESHTAEFADFVYTMSVPLTVSLFTYSF